MDRLAKSKWLTLKGEQMLSYMDATDALAAAYCHYLQDGREDKTFGVPHSWAAFVKQNQNRVAVLPNKSRLKIDNCQTKKTLKE